MGDFTKLPGEWITNWLIVITGTEYQTERGSTARIFSRKHFFAARQNEVICRETGENANTFSMA